jgi:hypothetical protein
MGLLHNVGALVLVLAVSMLLCNAFNRQASSLRLHRFGSAIGAGVATQSSSSLRSSPEKVYDYTAVEKKWQDYWDEHKTFEAKRRPGHKVILDVVGRQRHARTAE